MDSRAAALELLLDAARHKDGSWRIEGSADWETRPGRLTVWCDLTLEEFDRVYDALNSPNDEVRLAR